MPQHDVHTIVDDSLTAAPPGEIQDVDAEEFCRLAISPRKLYRADDPTGLRRGLFEPLTGVRYTISERTLREYLQTTDF